MNRMIKYYLSKGIFAMTPLLLAGAFVSCADDVVVGSYDSGDLDDAVNGIYVTMRNAEGADGRALEVRTGESTVSSYYVELSKTAEQAVDISVKIDEKLLEAYNEANNTSYAIYPMNLVTIEDDGAAVILPGKRKSEPLEITLASGAALRAATTYVLPLSAVSLTEGVKLSKGATEKLIFVKSMGAIPSTAKPSGILTIVYVECNNNNILNAGEWTLATSGKQIIDIVNIFAGNVNYVQEQGRVAVTLNPNIQNILNNADTYIRPLQAKGIKVCLTILGNGDQSGVANLSDGAAREFAAELKAIVDTYGLDGVDFDDEWSKYKKEPPFLPGLVKRNGDAYSRLCYEVKRAMPDKLCTVYNIGASIPDAGQDSYGFNKPVEGIYPGDYVDYSYFAQYGSLDMGYTAFLGMTRKQYGTGSVDLGNSPNLYNFDYLRNNGFGVQAVYDLRSNVGDWVQTQNQHNVFNAIAKKLYDDAAGARWSGIDHKK